MRSEAYGFRRRVLAYYRAHGRDFPWRRTEDPYKILVSEIMLQQTQTSRVLPYYEKFIKRFPTVRDLARASLGEVLMLWSGLGYNRRARALRDCAVAIMENHNGKVPSDFDELVALPGIGNYTAGALQAFAFGTPSVFIETNIRTVFIEAFYKRATLVRDQEIRLLVEKTLYRRDPRRWYYALMDYGVYLKETKPRSNQRSAHYRKQSRFEGSLRQERGRILKLLTTKSNLFERDLSNNPRGQRALAALVAEGLIVKMGAKFQLAR